jgi:hypothetical protein
MKIAEVRNPHNSFRQAGFSASARLPERFRFPAPPCHRKIRTPGILFTQDPIRLPDGFLISSWIPYAQREILVRITPLAGVCPSHPTDLTVTPDPAGAESIQPPRPVRHSLVEPERRPVFRHILWLSAY